MIYAAHIPSQDSSVVEQAYEIAWAYLVRRGYEDCMPHKVAVVGHLNEAIERGANHKLVLANRAIVAFEKAKAELEGEMQRAHR